MWQYAQLVVSYDRRLATEGGEWTLAWYGPDVTTESSARTYGGVVAELNGAGKEGWELIDLAVSGAEGSGHTSSGRDWPLTSYTFRRSSPPALSPGQAGAPAGQSGSLSQTTGTGQGTSAQSNDAAGPRTTEPVTLVRFTVYCRPDADSAARPGRNSARGSGTCRFLIGREVAHPHSQADIEAIESLGRLYEAPGVSSGLREQIKGAAADYAATWAEDQWGSTTWWQTPQSFPLSAAADWFDGSADWLRGLVELPAADALSAAGAEGPVVPVGAGITARLLTGPVAERLEGAARICEITGIVIGALLGAHALVMACAKRFFHDEANKLLGTAFEEVIDSIGRSLRATPEREIEGPESSRQTEPGDGRQPSPSDSTERGRPAVPSRDPNRLRRGMTEDGPDREGRRGRPPGSDLDFGSSGPASEARQERWSGADHARGTTPAHGESSQAIGRPGAGDVRRSTGPIREPGPEGGHGGSTWPGRLDHEPGRDIPPDRGDDTGRGDGR